MIYSVSHFPIFISNVHQLLCPQVYPSQPTSGSYAMSGTAVQGYVPMEQLPAAPPIPGQPAPG